eukprot:TRINITY_DN70200_c0_g1_i1.p1 TRINITY_DN70200_c0_g1~~TRINITY_DN70200_c0_g1_i1.p1  ORF type:complete len:510 (-),score=52.26 TRINITY_DN70200_c0_g1_i1:100-1629(-)
MVKLHGHAPIDVYNIYATAKDQVYSGYCADEDRKYVDARLVWPPTSKVYPAVHPSIPLKTVNNPDSYLRYTYGNDYRTPSGKHSTSVAEHGTWQHEHWLERCSGVLYWTGIDLRKCNPRWIFILTVSLTLLGFALLGCSAMGFLGMSGLLTGGYVLSIGLGVTSRTATNLTGIIGVEATAAKLGFAAHLLQFDFSLILWLFCDGQFSTRMELELSKNLLPLAVPAAIVASLDLMLAHFMPLLLANSWNLDFAFLIQMPALAYLWQRRFQELSTGFWIGVFLIAISGIVFTTGETSLMELPALCLLHVITGFASTAIFYQEALLKSRKSLYSISMLNMCFSFFGVVAAFVLGVISDSDFWDIDQWRKLNLPALAKMLLLGSDQWLFKGDETITWGGPWHVSPMPAAQILIFAAARVLQSYMLAWKSTLTVATFRIIPVAISLPLAWRFLHGNDHLRYAAVVYLVAGVYAVLLSDPVRKAELKRSDSGMCECSSHLDTQALSYRSRLEVEA